MKFRGALPVDPNANHRAQSRSCTLLRMHKFLNVPISNSGRRRCAVHVGACKFHSACTPRQSFVNRYYQNYHRRHRRQAPQGPLRSSSCSELCLSLDWRASPPPACPWVASAPRVLYPLGSCHSQQDRWRTSPMLLASVLLRSSWRASCFSCQVHVRPSAPISTAGGTTTPFRLSRNARPQWVDGRPA
jgi:hypothetical protein